MRASLVPNAFFLIAPLLAGVAGPAFAAPLPPPPYAIDQVQYGPDETSNGGAPAFDRYGGGASHPAPPPPTLKYAFAQQGQPMTSAPIQSPQRTLGWAGKTQHATVRTAGIQTASIEGARAEDWGRQNANSGNPTYTPAQPAPAQSAPVQSARVQSASSEDVGGWRSMPPPVRRTIYDPPQAGSARQPAYAQAQQTTSGPHFYSVHRDYGIQPDAIPIPPQFFGPTADLSAPPSDPTLKRVTNAAGQTRTVAVGGDDTGTQ
jgi:hypothetical protein